MVNIIEQGRLRRGFARTSWTGDQNKPATQMRKLLDRDRNAQLLQRGNPSRNQTKNCAVTVGLLQIIAPEARRLIHFIGKIEIAAFLENLPVVWTANFTQHRRRLVAGNRLAADRHDVAVFSYLGRLSFADMQIGSSMGDNHI